MLGRWLSGQSARCSRIKTRVWVPSIHVRAADHGGAQSNLSTGKVGTGGSRELTGQTA